MNRLLSLALTLALALSLTACGGGGAKDKDKDKDHKDQTHKDDDHKDHKHEKDVKDKGDHHDGEKFDLGAAKAGEYDVKVVQIGKPAKGEGILEIVIDGPKGAAAVRVWAGSADAKGAVKAKADYAPGGDLDVHVEVADKLPADAKWHIEIEPTGGKVVTASFDIKK